MSCFNCLFTRGESSPSGTVETEEEFSGVLNVRTYSYKELKHATDDFSQHNKIGEGGFGFVYKETVCLTDEMLVNAQGRLKDGTIVAIKVLAAESRQGVREFLTEINVLEDRTPVHARQSKAPPIHVDHYEISDR
ncbi:putative LRR receptor-like serine/threonine-protein kinase [Acorus gramineus]|uniref:LRR receptor-like serine/threonine-protein kinase n=1 Tax=Acorus gramineus TaxID=55184 RepID=A0AAV9A7W4_ACOGR|nr:putative LRR receptor-like serine/threonine-protein kinase [Acorus gramineus]